MPLEPGVIAHLRHGKPLWAEYLTKQPKQNRKQQNQPASTPTAPPRDRRNLSFFLKKINNSGGRGGGGSYRGAGLNPVPKNAPPGNTQDCDMGNKEQPNPNSTVVDLTTTTDDPPRQSPTEASSANQAEEQLSETTVRTPSISGSDVGRRDSLVNQARLERLQEEKHRVDKEHEHKLEKHRVDTKRRLLDSEIDQTRTELVGEEEEASNRSLSTSVKSSRK